MLTLASCIMMCLMGIPLGTEVLVVNADGPPLETVVYGIDLPLDIEGVFEIDSETGNITVGRNGPNRLVISNQQPTQFNFQIFAYFFSAGPNGSRVRTAISPIYIFLNSNSA